MTSGSPEAPASPAAGACCRSTFRHFRRCNHFLADVDDVRHGGIFRGHVFDLVRVGQAAYADHLVHAQLAHIHIDVTGNVRRQALDLNFAQHLIENSAFGLDADRYAQQFDADSHAQKLVERDALQVNVNQLVLDWLALPIDDHGLGGGMSGDLDIEDGVMAGLGVEDPRNLFRIQLQQQRDRIPNRKVPQEFCLQRARGGLRFY